MINQNKRKFASILFVLISFVCTAQPPPPPPPGLSVDGGALIVVLILGIVYGIKKKLDLIKTLGANLGGIH